VVTAEDAVEPADAEDPGDSAAGDLTTEPGDVTADDPAAGERAEASEPS
jgi:hypothetical protein